MLKFEVKDLMDMEMEPQLNLAIFPFTRAHKKIYIFVHVLSWIIFKEIVCSTQ